MIVLDANVIVSAIAGTHTRAVLKTAAVRGVQFVAPQPQLEEAARVLNFGVGAPVWSTRNMLHA